MNWIHSLRIGMARENNFGLETSVHYIYQCISIFTIKHLFGLSYILQTSAHPPSVLPSAAECESFAELPLSSSIL